MSCLSELRFVFIVRLRPAAQHEISHKSMLKECAVDDAFLNRQTKNTGSKGSELHLGQKKTDVV